MKRLYTKQSPDFALAEGHCKLFSGNDDSPKSYYHREEMEDQDINRCVTSSSGPEPFSPSLSPVYETRDTVEELTVKNMLDASVRCSPSGATSRLDQSQHLCSVSSEPGTSFASQERNRTVFGLRHIRSIIHPQNDTQRPLLETYGSVGNVEGTSSSSQQRYLDKIPQVKPDFSNGGVSLREWLKPGYSRRISKTEALQLFRHIVELVDFAHSQDIVLKELRPSRFILLPSNKVKYSGASMRSRAIHSLMNSDSKRKRLLVEEDINVCTSTGSKHQKLGQENHSMSSKLQAQSNFSTQSMYHHHPIIAQSEKEWYSSPEECNGLDLGFPSNIYSLGVLLFELLCSFESPDAHLLAMSDVQRRVLPSSFLSENPKEAGFCLLFLHPEHLSRPTTREILQSDLFHVPPECYFVEKAMISPHENDAELELLLHFLTSMKEQKSRQASKLTDDIRRIEEDLKEMQRNYVALDSSLPSCSWTEETSWMGNMSQLEESYFLMRSQCQVRETSAGQNPTPINDLLTSREKWNEKPFNQLGPFFEALSKFTRYTKFEVRGSLKCGDILNSSNVIRSIGFNRDEEYIATAGVSKKIKVFEFSSLLDDSIDIHYPAVEMSNMSKLSCICWNSYMRSFLASTDYDGLVQIWDAGTARSVSQYSEHQKRAWCVDFCQVDPTRFASGSDDCSVKLWRINERNSIGTIWSPANVCSVQFAAHSANLLVFGCADNNIYCYDLRNTRAPWCTLSGHAKTVSYVKFLDFETLVSASTDNSLKMWNLKGRSSNASSSNGCTRTFKGHTNEKNFVGLSLFDGYIACGSETNEVYCYYKSLPMPITSHKFVPLDPASGIEIGSDEGHFVSSVCWGRRSNMVVAANSAGSLKVLQMV